MSAYGLHAHTPAERLPAREHFALLRLGRSCETGGGAGALTSGRDGGKMQGGAAVRWRRDEGTDVGWGHTIRVKAVAADEVRQALHLQLSRGGDGEKKINFLRV